MQICVICVLSPKLEEYRKTEDYGKSIGLMHTLHFFRCDFFRIKLIVFFGELSSGSSHKPRHQVLLVVSLLSSPSLIFCVYGNAIFSITFYKGKKRGAFLQVPPEERPVLWWITCMAKSSGTGIWWRSEFHAAISRAGRGDTIIWEQPPPTQGMFWPPAVAVLMGTGT